MFLTILVPCPTELGWEYLYLYREAMLRWNKAGLAETQVILLPQGKLPSVDLDPFQVINVPFDKVGKYPIWDVMRSIRAAWPHVRGEYVSVDHPEFLWGPDRLDRTIAWLKGYRPIMGIGNLRRPGAMKETSNDSEARDAISKDACSWFRTFLNRDDWSDAAGAFEYLQTVQWTYWAPTAPAGPTMWMEDVFYADKAWLDTWGFARYDLEMPFQDVYDVLQVSTKMMAQYGLPVMCQRMPQRINKLMHLWHPRPWSSFVAEIRDWFLSDPTRWQKSSLGNKDLWNDLIAYAKSPAGKPYNPVHTVRFGPRGTATNYAVSLSTWLNAGGVEALQEFFENRREQLLGAA